MIYFLNIMLAIKQKLNQLSLTTNNSIIIGSGILNALNIRTSHDIDIVVDQETFSKLKKDMRFKKANPFGLEILKYDVYEIGTGWNIQNLNKIFTFEELFSKSTIINGVRYINLDLLYEIKKSLRNNIDRKDKDNHDIHLIEEYLKSKREN